MYHSLTFGNLNTWDKWHLVPESRPIINPPKPKTNYVDIPGTDGSLDYTEALGSVKFENREGSWSFYVMNDYGEKNFDYDYWWEIYNSLLSEIHGRRMQIYSEDDPQYLYYGRLSLDEWNSEKDYSKVTISYVIDPYKYRAVINDDGTIERDTTISTSGNDWLWDELFDNTIIYGKFDVDEQKVRTLINRTGKEIIPSITCTTNMEVLFNNTTYQLKNGKNVDHGIVLDIGSNVMTFIGNGQVTIDYDKDGVII